ncbi:MAG: hypothetical protein HY226_01720 [Candidatus Vogelbacteria bacterium]|nr:hypothetical protein [Candidatus Vogelbacteria bacterium]
MKLVDGSVQKVVIVLNGSIERLEAELRYEDGDDSKPTLLVLVGSLKGQTITPKTHKYRIVKILYSSLPVVDAQ